MENIPNFQNWLDNLDEDSNSRASNQIYMVEHLLKKRKEALSLLVIENLRLGIARERLREDVFGLVKCSCNDNYCCNRMTYLSIIDINTQLGQRQLELRSIRKKNVAGINTDLQMMPTYKIVTPIFWYHRVEAAKTIQKWWKRASFQKKRRDAAKTIQKYWREAISNPNYVVCRNRLIHEYPGMM